MKRLRLLSFEWNSSWKTHIDPSHPPLDELQPVKHIVEEVVKKELPMWPRFPRGNETFLPARRLSSLSALAFPQDWKNGTDSRGGRELNIWPETMSGSVGTRVKQSVLNNALAISVPRRTKWLVQKRNVKRVGVNVTVCLHISTRATASYRSLFYARKILYSQPFRSFSDSIRCWSIILRKSYEEVRSGGTRHSEGKNYRWSLRSMS